MVAKALTGALSGVDGSLVQAEADVSPGQPRFEIGGLPDVSIKEARERIRAAVTNSGYRFPSVKLTVNLAPAYIRKEGSGFDLPIACAVLGCLGKLPKETAEVMIIGELSLDGGVKPVNGVLPLVIAARDAGVTRALVPYENSREAALVKGIEVYAVSRLSDVAAFFAGKGSPPVNVNVDELYSSGLGGFDVDFSDVKGQEEMKRALLVAASGMHNILMIGRPGSGKTMMAKRLTTILPDLSFEESLEVTKIYSVAGLVSNRNALVTKLPFRAPHHTISYAALTGGGKFPKPGEISLAHRGVLFLDELPEFHKNVLEVLRQPMEDGYINIARVSGNISYPSNFMLVASMNPCPCGFYGQGDKCRCSQTDIRRYLSKVSGPLLDRIDIQIESKKVEFEDLNKLEPGESSASMRAKIQDALTIQKERYKHDGITCNSELRAGLIDKYCELGSDSTRLLKTAMNTMGMSARAYHKVLMMARTIADLARSDKIEARHVAEAIQYRSLDRKYFGA